MTRHIIDRLFETINARKEADPAVSYVARLHEAGTAKCAQKFGEEAVETVIEAMKVVTGDKAARATFTEESADAVFHLLVLWSQLGFTPEDIWAVLESRVGKISDKDLK